MATKSNYKKICWSPKRRRFDVISNPQNNIQLSWHFRGSLPLCADGYPAMKRKRRRKWGSDIINLYIRDPPESTTHSVLWLFLKRKPWKWSLETFFIYRLVPNPPFGHQSRHSWRWISLYTGPWSSIVPERPFLDANYYQLEAVKIDWITDWDIKRLCGSVKSAQRWFLAPLYVDQWSFIGHGTSPLKNIRKEWVSEKGKIRNLIFSSFQHHRWLLADLEWNCCGSRLNSHQFTTTRDTRGMVILASSSPRD